VDWATAVAAVGGGLVGGLLALFGGLVQSRDARQRFEKEAKAAVLLECKRVYLEFLTCVRAHDEGIVSAETMVAYDKWFRGEYLGRYNAVLLEGPDCVVMCTDEVHKKLIDVRDATYRRTGPGGERWQVEYHDAYEKDKRSIKVAIREVESAMRARTRGEPGSSDDPV
jgi:hypothetical protein